MGQPLLHRIEVIRRSIVYLSRRFVGAGLRLLIGSTNRLGALALPETEDAGRVTHDQHAGVVRYLQRRDADHRLVHLPELTHLLHLEVPNLDLSRLVAKDDLNLVRMQHSAVNHHSIVIALPLVARRVKVKDFDCAVLARDKEPFVLALEDHGDCVCRQPIERHLLALVKHG